MQSFESWENGLASLMLPSVKQFYLFLIFFFTSLEVLATAGAYERSFRVGLLYLAFYVFFFFASLLQSSRKPVSTHCTVTAFLPCSFFFPFCICILFVCLSSSLTFSTICYHSHGLFSQFLLMSCFVQLCHFHLQFL